MVGAAHGGESPRYVDPRYVNRWQATARSASTSRRVSIVGEDWGQDIEQVAHYFSDQKIDSPYSVMYGLIAEHEFHRHGISPYAITCDSSVPEEA